MASTFSSIVAHFNGHGSLPVQYETHCPVHHVQGYSGSHWTLQLGNYFSPICSSSPQGNSKQKEDEKNHQKDWPF
jgi:hypothetical protein